jgi:hypothetical protein
MAALLTSVQCGWPGEEVHERKDPELPDSLPAQLVDRFQPARQVALFYFVGHGQYDTEEQLCLAVRESRTEAHLRRVTSLDWESVRYALRLSRAKTKIVILDCCYANLAGASIGRLGPSDPLERLRGTGAFIMAACSEYGLAGYETDPAAGPPETYFTKYFVDTVERGIKGEGPRLRLGPLFNQIAEQMAYDGLPVPVSNSREYATDFEFADNVAYGSSPAGPRPPLEGGVSASPADGDPAVQAAAPEPAVRLSPALEEQLRRAEQMRFLAIGAAAGAIVAAEAVHASQTHDGLNDLPHPLADPVEGALHPLHPQDAVHSLHSPHTPDGGVTHPHLPHSAGDTSSGDSGYDAS